MNSQLFASAVTMPVLMFQVLEDAGTKNPEDACSWGPTIIGTKTW